MAEYSGVHSSPQREYEASLTEGPVLYAPSDVCNSPPFGFHPDHDSYPDGSFSQTYQEASFSDALYAPSDVCKSPPFGFPPDCDSYPDGSFPNVSQEAPFSQGLAMWASSDVCSPPPVAFPLHPDGSFPHASQPSVTEKKKKNKKQQQQPMLGFFSNGKQKMYNMPSNPDDPEFEKRRKKSVQSFNNRLGGKLETENLQTAEKDLLRQIKGLYQNKAEYQARVQYLEQLAQNSQYQACGVQEYPAFPTMM